MRFESDDETEISDRQPLLKMSKTQDDPFYQIRDEVKIQVDQLKVRFQRLQELVRIEDASSKQEFTELRRGLVKDVRNADKKVRGLKEAVEVVEKNRHKFSHIRDGELQSRKAFVDQIQIAINDIKVGMEAPAVRKKIESDAQNTQQLQQSNVELSSNPSAVANNGRRPNSINNNNNNPYNPMKSQIESENNDFIRDNKSQQTLMIKKQDENLGLLEKGVDSLGVLAKGIKN